MCSSAKPWIQTLVRRLAQQQKSSSPLICFFQSFQGPVNFIRSAFGVNVQFSVCLVRGSLSSSGSKQTLDFEKATKEVLLLVFRWPRPGQHGGLPVQLGSLCSLGIMRRAGEEADTGVPRGQGHGWGHWPGCARTSPHTQVLCSVLSRASLSRRKQRRRAAALVRCILAPSARNNPLFLRPNATAEMSSLFCSAGICQLGGYKDSIH